MTAEPYINGLLLILISGILGLLISNKKILLPLTAALSAIGNLLLAFASFRAVMENAHITVSLPLGFPAGNSVFSIDPLSAYFVFVFSVIGAAASVYSAGYLKTSGSRGQAFHIFCLNLLLFSMSALVMSRNAFLFVFFWETMSLSSFFLVTGDGGKKDSVSAGIYYLVSMQLSAVFLILAFYYMSSRSGSLDMSSYRAVFAEGGWGALAMFFMFFAGFGIKAGFMPFHTWIYKAHPAAPSNVSGLMSGIMIKTGIYGIIRIFTLMPAGGRGPAYTVIGFSLVSALVGILYSLAQRDLKKLLAYCSVENIGIIGLGLGSGFLGLSLGNNTLALLGLSGGLLHILNHALFKTLLFYSSGNVYVRTHTMDMESLGGLVKAMPYSAGLFFTGAAAISALPPLNGFVSELLIYAGFFSGLDGGGLFNTFVCALLASSLALTGAISFFAFAKAFGIVFSGSPRVERHGVIREAPLSMLLPTAGIALMALLIGLLPQYAFRFILNVAGSAAGMNLAESASAGLFGFLGMVSRCGIAFFTLSAFIYLLRALILKNRKVSSSGTWGCGYQAPDARMQYTSASFSSPLVRQAGALAGFSESGGEQKGLFPTATNYTAAGRDLSESVLVRPFARAMGILMGRFRWVQSGSLHLYILYGLIFLIAAAIWIMKG